MKSIILILTFLLIFSCKENCKTSSEELAPMEESHLRMHEEEGKVSEELKKFDTLLVKLYKESDATPEKVIVKIDSLLNVNQTENDKYKSQIKPNIAEKLHYFKAELSYKLGNYNKSIVELNSGNHDRGDDAVAYAANYVKLNDLKNAKISIDSIEEWCRNTDYATANYYECIGNRVKALEIYTAIKNDKSNKHRFYYKLAINRLNELEKGNPKLLHEIYFPTNDPSFEYAHSDNEIRSKIMDLLVSLPENKNWTGTAILDYPQINDTQYYVVRVSNKRKEDNYYYVHQKTFEIKCFDRKNKKVVTLEEWRKLNKKNGL